MASRDEASGSGADGVPLVGAALAAAISACMGCQ